MDQKSGHADRVSGLMKALKGGGFTEQEISLMLSQVSVADSNVELKESQEQETARLRSYMTTKYSEQDPDREDYKKSVYERLNIKI